MQTQYVFSYILRAQQETPYWWIVLFLTVMRDSKSRDTDHCLSSGNILLSHAIFNQLLYWVFQASTYNFSIHTIYKMTKQYTKGNKNKKRICKSLGRCLMWERIWSCWVIGHKHSKLSNKVEKESFHLKWDNKHLSCGNEGPWKA